MSIFLNASIDRFSLIIFDSQTKSGRIIVLLLAVFEMDIHLLKLVKEVINKFNSIKLGFLLFRFQRHDK